MSETRQKHCVTNRRLGNDVCHQDLTTNGHAVAEEESGCFVLKDILPSDLQKSVATAGISGDKLRPNKANLSPQ